MTNGVRMNQWSDEELHARKLVIKLRWMGFDDEADRLVAEIKASGSPFAARLPSRLPATD